MGMPPIADDSKAPSNASLYEDKEVLSVASDEEDEKGIHQAMQDIEKELREAGALDLNPKHEADLTSHRNSAKRGSNSGQSISLGEAEDASESEDANIDFNLAKNMLESFKSQGGGPGPGGNMINAMGMSLPRDESD